MSPAIEQAIKRGEEQLRYIRWLNDSADETTVESYWLHNTILHIDWCRVGRMAVKNDRILHYSNPLNVGRKYVGDLFFPLDTETDFCIIDVDLGT